jgi:hypothetical protein
MCGLIQFEWNEIEARVHECRRAGGSHALGHVVDGVRGGWFARIGYADIAPAPSDPAAKRIVE